MIVGIQLDPHFLVWKLVVGYTLVGAFVVTVYITILIMLGRDSDGLTQIQKNSLFVGLIIELVAICLSFFGGALNANEVATAIDDQVKTAQSEELRADFLKKSLEIARDDANAYAKLLVQNDREIMLFRSEQLRDGWYRARSGRKNIDTQLTLLEKGKRLTLEPAKGDLNFTVIHSGASGGGAGLKDGLQIKSYEYGEDLFVSVHADPTKIVGWHVDGGNDIGEVEVAAIPEADGRYRVRVRPIHPEGVYRSGKTKNHRIESWALSAYVSPTIN